MPKNKDEILEEAKKRFKFVQDAESEQRIREREDLEFQVPELQWDEASRSEREGGRAGDTIIPPRPTLSISLLNQPVQLIQNQAATAHMGVEIHPVSEDADDELAEVMQGLYRRIERDSNAHMARLWALSRATQAGRGWYRVSTQYDEDSDKTNDQEIVIERIMNQEDVYVDPSATKPDCSDARWGMLVCWVPQDAFEEMFPDAELPGNNAEWAMWANSDPAWVRNSDDNPAVLVAEYWYKEFDGEKVKKLHYCKLSPREVLEQQEWEGKHIPLIPVWGKELIPFDGERRWEGVVRQARDAQKTANHMISNMVETLGTKTKAPVIGTAEQFEGFEKWWEQANVRNFPYLLYNSATDKQGNPVPPPQRAPIDFSDTQMFMAAFAQSRELVQTTTAIFSPSLGEIPQDQTAQSGRAILALQQQADAGTSHFLQNLAKVSMIYEAKVILDLMPKIYDRPGRITQILGEDDNAKPVMLNKPFMPGPNGRPMPAPPMPGPPQAGPPPVPQGMPPGPPGPPPPPPQQPQGNVKNYDLSKGKYSVSVSVGRAFQTRLQEGSSHLVALMEKAPQLMPMIGDLVFKFQDWPGAKEVAERLERMRKQQFPGLGGEEDEQMSLPQAVQMIQGLQGQMQQMGQALQAAQMKIETDQAKQQATLAKTQMESDVKMQLAQLEAQVRMAIEQMKQGGKTLELDVKTSEGDKQRTHEVGMQDDWEAHEVGIEAMKQEAQDERAEKQNSFMNEPHE